MKTLKTSRNTKQNFIWILAGLMFIGLLGLPEMSLAKQGRWRKRANMPRARGWLSTSAVNGKIYAIGGSNEIGKAFSSWKCTTPQRIGG